MSTEIQELREEIAALQKRIAELEQKLHSLSPNQPPYNPAPVGSGRDWVLPCVVGEEASGGRSA